MKNAELAMTVIGTGLGAYLWLLLWVRKLHLQFRFFSFYTLVSAITGILLLVVRNPKMYFYVYWSGEALTVVLAFLALQESFYLVFRNFLSIRGFKFLFPGIGVLVLCIAIGRGMTHPVAQAGMVTSTLILLEIAVNFLQFGIFSLFILLVRFFHMRWRQRAFGVVLGFGATAAGYLVALLLRSEFGTKYNLVARLTPGIAYIIGVVTWLFTVVRAEMAVPAQPGLQGLTPAQMASDFRRYTNAVKGILER